MRRRSRQKHSSRTRDHRPRRSLVSSASRQFRGCAPSRPRRRMPETPGTTSDSLAARGKQQPPLKGEASRKYHRRFVAADEVVACFVRTYGEFFFAKSPPTPAWKSWHAVAVTELFYPGNRTPYGLGRQISAHRSFNCEHGSCRNPNCQPVFLVNTAEIRSFLSRSITIETSPCLRS